MATADAVEGNPIFRGVLVREQLLCEHLPPPPADIPPLPAPMGGVTVRERVEEHTAPELCQSCHRHIDRLGFAFGHFDAIGRFQQLEGESPIDTTGALTFMSDASVSAPFGDARALAELLATRQEAYTCFARQWLRYALGRQEQVADSDSLESATETFRAAGYDVRELLVAIATSRAFRTPGGSP